MDDQSRDEIPQGQVDRIAAPLRAAERLSPGFEDRLLSRVRREAVATAHQVPSHRSWWTTPRPIMRTPLMSTLLMSGFAAIIAAAALMMPRSRPATSAPALASDTLYVVKFVYVDSTAKGIAVAGDFNGWASSATPLVARDGTGMWTATVVMPAGRHEYAFLVDGKRWVADPSALSMRDEFGTPVSMVMLGAGDGNATE